MSWIESINRFGEANAGAFNILSGVGDAASVVGFFMDLEFRENVQNSLDDIKFYLGRVEQNTIKIIAQNEEILRKLDQLPTRLEVKIMLRQAVTEGFLRRAYASLHAAENDVQEYWSATSPNWINFRDSLQFAFDHDNQVSSTAELLAHCSFAFLITRGAAKSFVLNIVTARRDRLKELQLKAKQITTDMLHELKDQYLGNGDYIDSHNLGGNLDDLSAVVFTMKPNRYDWIDGPCLVPVDRGGNCLEPGGPVRILDHDFSRKRDSHKAATQNFLEATDAQNNELGELTELITRLDRIIALLQL